MLGIVEEDIKYVALKHIPDGVWRYSSFINKMPSKLSLGAMLGIMEGHDVVSNDSKEGVYFDFHLDANTIQSKGVFGNSRIYLVSTINLESGAMEIYHGLTFVSANSIEEAKKTLAKYTYSNTNVWCGYFTK